MGVYEVEGALRGAGDGSLIAGLVREFHAAGLPLNSHSNVYENSRVVKSGPGFLFGIAGYNSAVSAQFIQVHDLAVKPASGAVPVLTLTVPTVANFSVLWALPGRAFQLGIVLVNSSTGPTYTAGAADCWFDAQYI